MPVKLGELLLKENMFEGLGAELPLPTRIVIAISNWFVRLLPFIVIGIILFVIFFKRYYATYSGRRVIDRMSPSCLALR